MASNQVIEKMMEKPVSKKREEPQLPPLPERLYTVREVAERLRVDATTVRRWVMMGIFPAVILPHQGKRQAYRFTQQSIDAVLNSGMKETLP